MPSSIEWTDETWNPVTGCSRVSPGCDHCYMFTLYPRLKGMGVSGYRSSPDDVTLIPERLEIPYTWKNPRHVFVNSMSDVFHNRIPFDFIYRIFRVMQESSDRHGHVFQVLTKRPGRAVAWWKAYEESFPDGWPPGVWIGTSVENQKYAPRLTVLARLPATIRFVSAEPLLEQVDLEPWLENGELQWVIVGGESGPGARPMELNWVRYLRDQSVNASVPFFLKQLGGSRNKQSGDTAVVDGRQWREMPITEMNT